jgi:hypothetical protein
MKRPVRVEGESDAADAASCSKKDCDEMTVTTAAPAEDSKSVASFSSKDLGRWIDDG